MVARLAGDLRLGFGAPMKLKRKRAMDEVVFLGLGLLVGVLLGYFIGLQRGIRRVQGQVVALLRALRAGQPPESGERLPGEIAALTEMRALLAEQWSAGSVDSEDGTLALDRVAEYLKVRVAEPLSEALGHEDHELRRWIESVLDAVDDMRFYLQAPSETAERVTTNLVDLVGDVTREFAEDMTVRLKVDAPPGPLRADVDPEPLKDALFLILHNAGEYGSGESVEVTLRKAADSVHILVRDRGPGFSAEALIKAMDPFYSTTPGGLGLGLPYARSAVRAQGGEVLLRNPEEGGAEVEIILPQD